MRRSMPCDDVEVGAWQERDCQRRARPSKLSPPRFGLGSEWVLVGVCDVVGRDAGPTRDRARSGLPRLENCEKRTFAAREVLDDADR